MPQMVRPGQVSSLGLAACLAAHSCSGSRHQNACFTSKSIGLVSMPPLLIIARGGLACSDLHPHDLINVAIAEPAPLALPRVKSGGSASDMLAADADGGRRPERNGAGFVDRSQGRAQCRRRNLVPCLQRFT
jgi:hypothetical protein